MGVCYVAKGYKTKNVESSFSFLRRSNHGKSFINFTLTVEQQTRKNSNFPVRGIFKNPREIIVNILR